MQNQLQLVYSKKIKKNKEKKKKKKTNINILFFQIFLFFFSFFFMIILDSSGRFIAVGYPTVNHVFIFDRTQLPNNSNPLQVIVLPFEGE